MSTLLGPPCHPPAGRPTAGRTDTAAALPATIPVTVLAETVWRSRRERLLDDADCYRIARAIARGDHHLSGRSETGLTAAHAGHTEPATGDAGRGAPSCRGDRGAARPDSFYPYATRPGTLRGRMA